MNFAPDPAARQAALDRPLKPTPLLDQALYGYDSGHRLLRSSARIAESDAQMLARLTDGTGATGMSGFDGHLAGYPLPSGRYALTRTWTAPEASRPGAVWTHVLLLDRRHLGRGFNPTALAGLLRRPSNGAEYDQPLPVPRSPAQIPPPVHGQFDAWRPLIAALFSPASAQAWATADDADSAEEAVLGIWGWLWPAQRRSFAFTIGAASPRRVDDRPFDLLIVPRSRRLAAVADLGPEPATTTLAADLIAADLEGTLPTSFGDFCRFCAGESRTRAGAAHLAQAWHAATQAQPGEDATRTLFSLADDAGRRYPDVREMRRYKRLLVQPDKRLPAPWTTDDAVLALALTPLGAATSATDVDAQALARAATAPVALATAAGTAAPNGSAVASVAAAARAAIAARARPDWLSALAEHAPTEAAVVLSALPPGERRAWANAYWKLTPIARRRAAPADMLPSLAWLAASAPRPTDGARMLAAFAKCPDLIGAMSAFADALAEEPDDRRSAWNAWLTDDAVVTAAVVAAPSLAVPAAAALLAALSPDAPPVRQAALRPWRQLAQQRPAPAVATNVLLLTPAGRPNKAEILLASRAFAAVWDALSDGDDATWLAIGAWPSDLGATAEWDRARRVCHRFAAVVRGWDQARSSTDAAAKATAAARRDSTRAADQLEEELAKAGVQPKSKGGKGKPKRTRVERVVDGIKTLTRW